jgi:nucleoside-diphosphate-sugar epimerase
MKVLLLGGTGSIGGAVLRVLLDHGHEVFALGRSPQSREALKNAGAVPVEGDLQDPGKWIDCVDGVDGIIQAAAVWGDVMDEIDRRFVEVLLDNLKNDSSQKAFIYTGGCWLYGETGDAVATETTPFMPPASFSGAIPTVQMVLSSACVRGMVIHPAMVYERNGGVFSHIFEDAENLGFVQVIGGENVRWPLIHRDDLAQLYALMLEKGKQGDVYNAAANDGVTIGTITRAIATRLGIESEPVVLDVEGAKVRIGSWAEGYAIDQQMSGQKARQVLGWCPEHEDVIADVS